MKPKTALYVFAFFVLSVGAANALAIVSTSEPPAPPSKATLSPSDAAAFAMNTPTAVPSPVAATATPEVATPSIPGLFAVDVTGNLKNRGLQCSDVTRTALPAYVTWSCKRTSPSGDIEYDVLITGRGPTRIESVNATIFQYGAAPSDATAEEFLGYIATTPYDGATPAAAKAWAQAHIAGGTTTIARVKFELVKAATGRAHFLVLSAE